MKTLHIKTTAALCKRLFRLERSGQYQKAINELDHIWQDKTAMPEVENLEPKLAAEIFLRCGSLIGFYGHNKQIPKSQEKSKNLLTEAKNRFLEICQIEKVAECENYMALAYWRTGELNEAEIWIEEAISHGLPDSSSVKIYSRIVNSIILIAKEKYEEVVLELKPFKSEFQDYGDDFLNGSFLMNLGLAYEKLNKPFQAIEMYESARLYNRKSKHQTYLGIVENNLAQTNKLIKDFPKAHESIDNAARIFKQIKDRTREGFSFDTKAQIFLAENKFSEALETAEKAIKILRLSENAAYLVETFLTKVKALIYLDRFSDATFCLVEAVQIAQTKISEEAAKNLIAEFEKTLQIKEARKINQAVTETAAHYKDQNSPAKKTAQKKTEKSKQSPKNDDDLELSLPKELAQYNSEDLRGVWISSTNLEGFGLIPDSLALIVKGEVKRGDLAAIEETASDDRVICGLYDTEFGLISLEGTNGDLQLFDADKFKILGKIIGVGKNKTTDGKLIIKPIDLV